MNLFSTLKSIFCCGSSMPAEQEPMLSSHIANRSSPRTNEGGHQQATTDGSMSDTYIRFNDALITALKSSVVVEANKDEGENSQAKTPPKIMEANTSSMHSSPGFGLEVRTPKSSREGTDSTYSSPGFGLEVRTPKSSREGVDSTQSSPGFGLEVRTPKSSREGTDSTYSSPGFGLEVRTPKSSRAGTDSIHSSPASPRFSV